MRQISDCEVCVALRIFQTVGQSGMRSLHPVRMSQTVRRKLELLADKNKLDEVRELLQKQEDIISSIVNVCIHYEAILALQPKHDC